MHYQPVSWKVKNQCCLCKKRAVTNFRCIGWGAIACMTAEGFGGIAHLQEVHIRYNKAMCVLQRAARFIRPTWA